MNFNRQRRRNKLVIAFAVLGCLAIYLATAWGAFELLR